jgi:hypothetical protein
MKTCNKCERAECQDLDTKKKESFGFRYCYEDVRIMFLKEADIARIVRGKIDDCIFLNQDKNQDNF